MINGNKVKYKDGIGCCIWQSFKDDKGEDQGGLCFDFSYDDIDELINVLKDLKTREAEQFIGSDEEKEMEARDREYEEKHNKWYRKIYDKYFHDISFQITPFEWEFRPYIISRKVTLFNKEWGYKWCSGFRFGPIMITWGPI